MKHKIESLLQELDNQKLSLELAAKILSQKIQRDIEALQHAYDKLATLKTEMSYLGFISTHEVEFAPEVLKFIEECEVRIINQE